MTMQWRLQVQLIAACKRGDDTAVTALLEQGAKPGLENHDGEHPLGAAIWGMNPTVVNLLITKNSGIAPMTWEECEQHNLKYYKKVFFVPEFDPVTYGGWYQLLQEIDPNPFIKAYHLKVVIERGMRGVTTWEDLKQQVRRNWQMEPHMQYKCDIGGRMSMRWEFGKSFWQTEWGYAGFRTQIKQEVETAKMRHKSNAFTSI